MAKKSRILRSYLNFILSDGSFQALEANGEQKREKAIKIARQYGASKAILHYCYDNGEIGEPDILFNETDKNHSLDD
tara:strand:- start:390 stop:620 length:231 start_codon:yes stop_codon:yes gene_type:complete